MTRRMTFRTFRISNLRLVSAYLIKKKTYVSPYRRRSRTCARFFVEISPRTVPRLQKFRRREYRPCVWIWSTSAPEFSHRITLRGISPAANRRRNRHRRFPPRERRKIPRIFLSLPLSSPSPPAYSR